MTTSFSTSFQLPKPRWRDAKSLGLGGLVLGAALRANEMQERPDRHFHEVGTGGVQIEWVVKPVGEQAITRSATTNPRGTIPGIGQTWGLT